MFKVLITRLKEGHHTFPFPQKMPVLSARYRGRPTIKNDRCLADCSACIEMCPTKAMTKDGGKLIIDLGKCLFCLDCMRSCPHEAISFSSDFSLSTSSREELVGVEKRMIKALDKKMLKLFGRSLKLRQVSAGGCNACEADTNVLNTLTFDLARFGIQFVAAPRHADGMLVTGPISLNMKQALIKTYQAIPEPKIVIVVGACAISGGPFIDHEEVTNGIDSFLPVDLYIPGCPPHPYTILDGMLRLLDRIK